jgi:hypothetical protein
MTNYSKVSIFYLYLVFHILYGCQTSCSIRVLTGMRQRHVEPCCCENTKSATNVQTIPSTTDGVRFWLFLLDSTDMFLLFLASDRVIFSFSFFSNCLTCFIFFCSNNPLDKVLTSEFNKEVKDILVHFLKSLSVNFLLRKNKMNYRNLKIQNSKVKKVSFKLEKPFHFQVLKME